MDRPAIRPDLSKGLLYAEHFQIAYATNEIDRAQELFRARYGITNWTRLEGDLPAGGRMRVELAWAGTVMYELMWSDGAGSAIYMDRLPAGDGFHVRHHHLGYLVGDADWDALMARAERDGLSVPHVSHNPGFMKSCFVDAPELGHYLEYICLADAMQSFFTTVAVN